MAMQPRLVTKEKNSPGGGGTCEIGGENERNGGESCQGGEGNQLVTRIYSVTPKDWPSRRSAGIKSSLSPLGGITVGEMRLLIVWGFFGRLSLKSSLIILAGGLDDQKGRGRGGGVNAGGGAWDRAPYPYMKRGGPEGVHHRPVRSHPQKGGTIVGKVARVAASVVKTGPGHIRVATGADPGLAGGREAKNRGLSSSITGSRPDGFLSGWVMYVGSRGNRGRSPCSRRTGGRGFSGEENQRGQDSVRTKVSPETWPWKLF